MTIADLNTYTRNLVDANSTSYSDANLLVAVNAAYEEMVGKLIALDTNWLFGDTNFAALPTGTTNLVAGTGAYAFDSSLLNIIRVEVKDNAGDWHELTPLDFADIPGAVQEYQTTDGLPTQYVKRENFITLYPAPAAANVTTSAGLKVYFQRTADVFTSGQVSTGTKTPGFASPYHIILCYKAALPYAVSYKKDRVPAFMNEIARLEKEMLAFYSKRSRDERPRMTMRRINHI